MRWVAPFPTTVICSKLAKKTPERPHWHEDIKKHWLRSGVSIVNFENIPLLFLVYHSWISGSVAAWVYQQRSKYRQVKIIKHAGADANCAILMRRVKLQHEKKPVSNLLSMQRVGFEQTLWHLLRISFRKNNFCTVKKRNGNHLSDHQW